MATDPIGDAVGETPTTELVSGAVGGRCANCQAPLASDQRYCLNCGQRRGKPRFSAMPAPATEPAAAAGSAARPPQHPRRSGAATLIAGVATLLIAVGVGFLIGHDSKSAPAQKAADQIITVGGGGTGTASNGASAASSTNPAQSSRPSAAGKASLKHAPKTVVVHLTPKVDKKVTAAAQKVFGQSGNLSKNVTQQVGGSCASGTQGCQNGKFTGNFFSP